MSRYKKKQKHLTQEINLKYDPKPISDLANAIQFQADYQKKVKPKRVWPSLISFLTLLVSAGGAISGILIYRLYIDQFEIVNSPNLEIQDLRYFFPSYNDPKSLKPEIPRKMLLTITNVGNHTIHAFRWRHYFRLDTSQAIIDGIRKTMYSEDSSEDFNLYIPPISANRWIQYYLPFLDSPKVGDDSLMKKAQCVLYLKIEYVNDTDDKWRSFILIARVKDRGTSDSMIDSVYLKTNVDDHLKLRMPTGN